MSVLLLSLRQAKRARAQRRNTSRDGAEFIVQRASHATQTAAAALAFTQTERTRSRLALCEPHLLSVTKNPLFSRSRSRLCPDVPGGRGKPHTRETPTKQHVGVSIQFQVPRSSRPSRSRPRWATSKEAVDAMVTGNGRRYELLPVVRALCEMREEHNSREEPLHCFSRASSHVLVPAGLSLRMRG